MRRESTANPNLKEHPIEAKGEPHVWFSKTGNELDIGPFSTVEKRKNLLACKRTEIKDIGIDAGDESSRQVAGALKALVPSARTGAPEISQDPIASVEERQDRLKGSFVISFEKTADESLTIFTKESRNYDEACIIRNALVQAGLFEDGAIIPTNDKALEVTSGNGIIVRADTEKKAKEIAEAIRNALT